MMWYCWRGHVHDEGEYALVRRHGRWPWSGCRCRALVPGGETCNGKLRPMTRGQMAAYLIGGGEAVVVDRAIAQAPCERK